MSNNDEIEKSIDKSKNKLVTITDRKGNAKKVWKHIEGTEVPAGINAGKSYEKTGKRHTEFEGYTSGDAVTFIAGGKEISGMFRHVNQSKHSTVAVVRGDDGKLYERGLSKIKRTEKAKQGDTRGQILENLQGAKRSQDSVSIRFHEKKLQEFDSKNSLVTTTKLGDKVLANQKTAEDGLQVFRNIVKNAKDLNHAYELISKIQNVSKEVSSKFRKLYDPESKLTPRQAFESFYNHVKSINTKIDEVPTNVSKFLKKYDESRPLQLELDKLQENPGISPSKKYSSKVKDLQNKIKALQIQEKNYAVKIGKYEYENFIPADINQNWQDFKDAYSIKDDNDNKKTLYIETNKLDKKKNPNFGGKKEDNFTDKVGNTSWERGDSVSFVSKSGRTLLGRVVKVDKELNATTVRQANGMTETVTNSKINP